REIYNDHIGAHIMAFVLAFARGLHTYIPQQLRRQWRPTGLDTGVIHLPEATALIVGVGGIGAEAARLAAAFGMHVLGVDARRAAPRGGRRPPPRGGSARSGRATRAGSARCAPAPSRLRDPDGATHARDRGVHAPRAFSTHEVHGVLHQHRPRHDHPARRPRP